MTKSYDPYANAIAEPINGFLKQEFMIDKFADNLPDKKKLVEDAIQKYNQILSRKVCKLKRET